MSGILVGRSRWNTPFPAGYRRRIVPLVRTSEGLAACNSITSYTVLGVRTLRLRGFEIGGRPTS